MTILDKARGDQNQLERLANSIPGFKGYRERELRRDADRLEREHLASRLEECKKPLNELATGLTRSGGLELMNDVETARKRLDKAIARIRYADRGYAGFFDVVKVDEAMLARVYEFDLSLLGGVEGVRASALAAEPTAAALKELIGAIDTLDGRLAEREEILGGIRP
jgi:hypothetical protein